MFDSLLKNYSNIDRRYKETNIFNRPTFYRYSACPIYIVSLQRQVNSVQYKGAFISVKIYYWFFCNVYQYYEIIPSKDINISKPPKIIFYNK